ncbi:ribosome silencing factor [Mumia sp. ZJ430]|uniref:ribosome silencing factor n=1 Tax=Mumia sp. ZJ430 TaxID=2708083 RepID=UPI00141F431A|nr:ribosome silencing factor [Mumia sp. ZJ430]
MTASPRALELTQVAAAAAADKLAHEIIAFDVSEHLVITDVFVIASASNDRQVRAVVDAVQEKLLEHGAKVVRREGEREGRWVLLDYADIVVHVQHDEDRSFYALERLWGDCPAIPLSGLGDAAGKAPATSQGVREGEDTDGVPLAGEPPVADA